MMSKEHMHNVNAARRVHDGVVDSRRRAVPK